MDICKRCSAALPVDVHGFTESFALTDRLTLPPEAYEFFDRFGILVIRNVLNSAESEASRAAIFDLLETNNGFHREDMNTWGNFPIDGMVKYGMPTRDPVVHPQFIANRVNPKLRAIFRELLGTDGLYVNHDRCSFMRPMLHPAADGTWNTVSNVHLDMNPWLYLSESQPLSVSAYHNMRSFFQENNFVVRSFGLCLQAVINFNENASEDGGFWAVPGFHKCFDEFFRNHPATTDGPSLHATGHSPLVLVRQLAQRVPMHAGSVVVWDQRIPHGSDGNSSFRPRMAQFVKMFPRKLLTPRLQQQRAALLLRSLSEVQIKDGWDLLFLKEPSRSEEEPQSASPKTKHWEPSRLGEESTAQPVKSKTRRWGRQ